MIRDCNSLTLVVPCLNSPRVLRFPSLMHTLLHAIQQALTPALSLLISSIKLTQIRARALFRSARGIFDTDRRLRISLSALVGVFALLLAVFIDYCRSEGLVACIEGVNSYHRIHGWGKMLGIIGAANGELNTRS